MAKSFIDVVQDSPRTRLGIPVKTKNPLPLSNTPPAEQPFCFKLHAPLVPAYRRVRLFRHPNARNHPRPPFAARPLGLTDQPRQPGEEKDPSPNRRGNPVRLGLAVEGAGPSRCFAYDAHPTLAFITSVTNDSMSVHLRSDWSIRETIVSVVTRLLVSLREALQVRVKTAMV